MSEIILPFENKPWQNADLVKAYDECEKVAVLDEDGMKLDVYKNQLEIITSEQMLEAYATTGLPIMYPHWSFGKDFVRESAKYKQGRSGLAYEIVINSDPCLAYLMEDNTLMMQILVIAHASFGHNYVFKNNYLFKERTDAGSIVEYLKYAKAFILEMEEKYGVKAVEKLLDHCHALGTNSIDKYKRKVLDLTKELQKEARLERAELYRQQYRPEWQALPEAALKRLMEEGGSSEDSKFPEEPQENLLRFVMEHSPVLEPWQREIVRIICNLREYFYPQMQTQVLNEGAASFIHYFICNRLFDKGILNSGHMLEFLKAHTSVVSQQETQAKFYQEQLVDMHMPNFNPYWLGYNILTDLRRICEAPTEEDKRWFPEFAGTPWLETWKHAVCNFRDESFISQFLSPNVMRKNRFMSVFDSSEDSYMRVEAVQDEDGYRTIRRELAENYNLSRKIPEIYVDSCDIKRSRSITLKFIRREGRQLYKPYAMATLAHFKELWGFPVTLEMINEKGVRYDMISM